MKKVSIIFLGIVILTTTSCLFLFQGVKRSLLTFYNPDGSIAYVIHEDSSGTRYYPDGSKRHYDAGDYGPSADGGWDYELGAPGEKQGHEGRTIWVDHGDGTIPYYTAEGEKLYTQDSQGNKIWYDRDGREAFREDTNRKITHLIKEKGRVEGVKEIKEKVNPSVAFTPFEKDNKKSPEDEIYNNPPATSKTTKNKGDESKPKRPGSLFNTPLPSGDIPDGRRFKSCTRYQNV